MVLAPEAVPAGPASHHNRPCRTQDKTRRPCRACAFRPSSRPLQSARASVFPPCQIVQGQGQDDHRNEISHLFWTFKTRWASACKACLISSPLPKGKEVSSHKKNSAWSWPAASMRSLYPSAQVSHIASHNPTLPRISSISACYRAWSGPGRSCGRWNKTPVE